ncbi:SDR family oxidoreductase [Methylophaga sp.]|uniref:UDP-glucose 4-epimerase family protein n=1 Tax=Methylophaga sp. TaxID=2024840 RepID=UPI0013FF0D6C|nr:SDR family oxidoreductase [Methylophaga sp.]MTI64688.1 SDR family oxidoreductase [Methylophaga sp.]
MKILVSGGTGFVGRALVSHLRGNGHAVSALVREVSSSLEGEVPQIICGDLVGLSDSPVPSGVKDVCDINKLRTALENTDTVIHTAARVHVMDDTAEEPLIEFRKVNTAATLGLAREAARAGVKRFIFLSTIKVNGESTYPGEPFSEQDICNPTDPYGISKYEAEQGLLQIAQKTGMEVVIIRPPLIYGPGVKGNFASMMRWVGKGIPLPLGAVNNQRSLLALENLLDFINCCLDHPKAANEVFLLSDGQDVSTTELIQKLAQAQGKKAWLLPVPVSLMKLAADLLGKRDVADRLFGSLQIDNSKACFKLNWSPVVSMDEQLRKMLK